MADGDLSESLAVVTGGGSGIGRAVCGALSKQGAKVVVADINQEAAEDTVKQLPGTEHYAIQVDVGDRQAVSSLFTIIKAHYNRVPDIIVNCAGISGDKPFLEATDKDFEDLINVNLKGTFMMTQEGCKHMIEENLKAGSIVNCASLEAHKAVQDLSMYSATKAGVVVLTKVVALEMAPHGIRANVVSPGLVDTPMSQTYFRKLQPEQHEAINQTLPLRRWGQPEEVAEVIVFLASRKSSYMTGSIVHVNGGMN